MPHVESSSVPAVDKLSSRMLSLEDDQAGETFCIGLRQSAGNSSQQPGWLGLGDDQKRYLRAIAKAEGAPPEALTNDETMAAWYKQYTAALQKAIKQNGN